MNEQQTTPDFRDILSTPISEVKRPQPLPVGSYYGVITQRRFDKSTEKGTLFVEFTIRLTGPGPDVNVEDLDGVDVSKKSLRHTFYLTNDALWRLTEFLKALGIEIKNKSLNEGIEEALNQSVIVDVTQQANRKKPSEPAFNNISDVRAA